MIALILNIKNKYFTLLLFLLVSSTYLSQCNNGNNFFPTTVQYPVLNQWWSATANNWAGEIIKVSVSNGENYQFSTCVSYGNVQASYDTELTLTDVNGTVLDFNDDYLGCGTGSYINWIASFSGEVYLHINDQNCSTNSIATEVMIFRSPASNCNAPSVTFNRTCQTNSTYDVALNISSLGSASSLNILNFDSIYFSNTQTGNFNILGLSGISNIIVEDQNDSTCFSSQSFSICNPCSYISAPSDLPCNAPSLNLVEPFYGSTNCGYTVSSGGNSNGPDNFCGNSNNDSWLVFTAADDTVILNWNIVYDPINGCDDGVQFAVLEGNCNNEDNMVELACYDPAGIFQSTGNFTIPSASTSNNPLNIGQEYFIYIDGYSGDLCDYYWIPKSGVATNPNNDSCENAKLISCGDRDTSNNILTINSNFPPSCSGIVPGNGIWYKFIGNDAILSVSTSNPATNFDTQIHVYEGSCDSLNLIGCDNNSGIGNTSQYSFLTTQGVEYYIYVNGTIGATGQFVVSFDCQFCDFSVSSSVINETCDGEDNGQIIIEIAGFGLFNIDTNGTMLIDSLSANTYNINNLNDGNYNISVQNLDFPNCDTSFSLYVNAGFNNYNLIIDTLICYGDSIIINNTIYNSNNNSGNEILSTINGCDSVINIILSERPEISFYVDTIICENDSILYNNVWYNFNNPIGEEIYMANNGCDSTVTIELNFNSLPNVSSNFSDSLICEDDTVIFYGTGANSYTWNNNILDSTLIIGPQEGEYIVTGIDSNNCQNSYHFFLSTEFCPREPYSLYIPNVMTSNQDGINDVFMITGTSYELISMKIFNRWGQLIFKDYNGRGWDGRLPSGLKASNGSYHYFIEVQPLTRPPSNSKKYNGILKLFSH